MTDEPTIPPIHPGEVLAEEYLTPLGATQHHGKRGISADTALRLARFFGTSERFWINLQSRYELEVGKDKLADALDQIRPLASS